jgi:UPF0755 protein
MYARRQARPLRRGVGAAVATAAALLAACSPEVDPEAPVAEFSVPSGATFDEVMDTLTARGVVTRPVLFEWYARWKGADGRIRAGRYAFPAPAPWPRLVDDLTRGRVLTEAVTFPEGWRLDQMVPRIAAFTAVGPDSVRALVAGDSAHLEWDVPGPGLEGYLFPETYRFAPGTSPRRIVAAMIEEWKAFWTAERLRRADSLGLDRRELTTLASIVQAEARHFEEMPRIAGVYHNRLHEGWLLQADPTVIYALGGYRERLLFAAIDSVADSPYNTYTQPGLPPGPIGAPGAAALQAALEPEAHDYMFFVAMPDGTHVFTRTAAEHNRAVAAARRARNRVRDGAVSDGDPGNRGRDGGRPDVSTAAR